MLGPHWFLPRNWIVLDRYPMLSHSLLYQPDLTNGIFTCQLHINSLYLLLPRSDSSGPLLDGFKSNRSSVDIKSRTPPSNQSSFLSSVHTIHHLKYSTLSIPLALLAGYTIPALSVCPIMCGLCFPPVLQSSCIMHGRARRKSRQSLFQIISDLLPRAR